jgi:hypothetical protein
MKFGYFLSSEEHTPTELLDHAMAAEEAGVYFGLHLRSLSPLDRPSGPKPVRMVCDRQGFFEFFNAELRPKLGA